MRCAILPKYFPENWMSACLKDMSVIVVRELYEREQGATGKWMKHKTNHFLFPTK